MANTTLERVEQSIEEQIVRYRELTDNRRVLRGRIERAEAEKRSVKDRVFQRVHSDYRRRLDEIESELEPIAADVQEARASIQTEIREIDGRTEELQDKIDEVTFRGRVGEYDADASNRLKTPLADDYERLVQRRRVLSDLLARIDEREGELPARDDLPHREMPVPAAPPASERTSEHAPSPAPAAPQPAPAAPQHASAAPRPEPQPADEIRTDSVTRGDSEVETGSEPEPAAAEAFVDPTEWVDEFVITEPQGAAKAAGSATTADTARPGDEMDNLSDLADPSDESVSAPDEGSSQPSERSIEPSDTLPILTVVSGPAAGKRLPLLPMTMTLGREVDNNIEIKDSEVARYHARISFEGGHYTIQDLEGSSGTFVDGQRISKTVLSPGSSIRVGNSELKLELG
jgi:hypothetical protein